MRISGAVSGIKQGSDRREEGAGKREFPLKAEERRERGREALKILGNFEKIPKKFQKAIDKVFRVW